MIKETKRAAPLAPSERQAAIIEAVTPLLVQRGSLVTSKELAEAAGIAEGTLFRAFGDKNSLIRAVLVAYVDSAVMEEQFADLPEEATLEETVRHLITVLTHHVRGSFAISSAFEHSVKRNFEHGSGPEHRHAKSRSESIQRITMAMKNQLESHRDELAVSPYRAAQFIRGVSFSAAFPEGNSAGDEEPLTATELANLVIRGVARPSSAAHDA